MSNSPKELKIKRDPVEQEALEDRLHKISEAKADLVKSVDGYLNGDDSELFITKVLKYNKDFNLVAVNDWIRQIRQVSSYEDSIKLIDQLFNPAA